MSSKLTNSFVYGASIDPILIATEHEPIPICRKVVGNISALMTNIIMKNPSSKVLPMNKMMVK